jgi:hypothetical protein
MKMECLSTVDFTSTLLIAIEDVIAYIHCAKLYCKAAGRQIFVSAKWMQDGVSKVVSHQPFCLIVFQGNLGRDWEYQREEKY